MAKPIVDTFEHDIADEIRHKEASIADIATAVGDIGNEEDLAPKHNVPLIVAVTVLSLCGLLGAGFIGYSYYSGTTTVPATSQNTTSEQKKTTQGVSVSSISPSMERSIGDYITNVQKSKTGYSMNITSYSPVFAYMLKNEHIYADELGLAVGNSKTIKKEQLIATSTTATTTPTSSTSTPKSGTTTLATTTTEVTKATELPTTYIFSDITISNQNMRVATSVYGTVVYAFIGTNRLVISSSTDGILALRSGVLQK